MTSLFSNAIVESIQLILPLFEQKFRVFAHLEKPIVMQRANTTVI